MLKLAAAEVRYLAASSVAWLAWTVVMSFWPALERPFLEAVPSVLAFLFLVAPITAVIGAFRALSVERTEGRFRLFLTLPVRPWQVAAARQLRSSALPLAVLVVGCLLVVVGVVGTGREFMATLSGSWILGVLFLASIALVALVTLLYDVGGMAFAQVGMALIAAVVFVAGAYAEGFARNVLEPINAFAQTPLALVVAAALCVSLWLADLVVLRWRGVL